MQANFAKARFTVLPSLLISLGFEEGANFRRPVARTDIASALMISKRRRQNGAKNW